MTVTARPTTRTPGRFTEADCSLADFAALVDQTTELADFPYADRRREERAGLRRRRRCAGRSPPTAAGSRSRPSWSGR